MKNIVLRIASALATITCAASLLDSIPASAMYITTTEGAKWFFQTYPLVYQNDEAAYYSNWDNGNVRVIYKKPQDNSTTVIHCYVDAAECDQETLMGIVVSIFDDSYSYECREGNLYVENLMYSKTNYVKAVQLEIYDRATRAETEAKADQLFAALNGKYTLYNYQCEFDSAVYVEYVGVENICEYFYRPDGSWGTKVPETGDKLKALIAEKYPDWEVRESGSEAEEVYTVRKKGVDDMYSIPLGEYLTIRDTVEKELGYYDMRFSMRPDITGITAGFKYYLGGSGDLNTDRERTVADAVLLSRCVAEDKDTPVTDKGLKEADLDCDGLLTVNDTCQLLDMLAAWK